MMNNSIEAKDGFIIIYMSGILTAKNLKEIEDEWEEQIAKKPQIIAVNLKNLEQIDSMGISFLVKFLKKTIVNDIEFIMYDLNSSTQKLFEVSKLDKFFNIMTKKSFEMKYL